MSAVVVGFTALEPLLDSRHNGRRNILVNRPISVLSFARLVSFLPSAAQQPEILNVSNVVAGSQRLETPCLGRCEWSEAGRDVATLSTEIHYYKRFHSERSKSCRNVVAAQTSF